jgi:chemotaxis protein methyltransferase CheR
VDVPVIHPSEARGAGRGRFPAPPERLDRESIELSLLLEGIYRQYGFDFREYAPASLKRRVWRRVHAERLTTIAGLLEQVLHDPEVMERLLLDLSINVTSMFRDPTFYAAFREKVAPLLRTYPFTRIWVAGCSTGEEVYSLAILLTEEGLYDRTRIYATDINELVLERARAGVFPLDKMQEYTDNYIRAGGRRSFSEYYLARYEGALFERTLTENVVWAPHNLVQDSAFNTFNVILCRNVMIYFDRPLQNRVHHLFLDSLERLGVLALGHKETIHFTEVQDHYDELDPGERLYRRVRRASGAVTAPSRGRWSRSAPRGAGCTPCGGSSPACRATSQPRSWSRSTARRTRTARRCASSSRRRRRSRCASRATRRPCAPGSPTWPLPTTTCSSTRAIWSSPSTSPSRSPVRRSTCCSSRPPTPTGSAASGSS